MTVRLRLALWNALILVLTIGGLGWILREKVRADLTSGIRSDLEQRARQFQMMFVGAPKGQPVLPGDFIRDAPFPPMPAPPPRRFRPDDAIGPRAFNADNQPALPGDTRPAFDRAALRHARETGEPYFSVVAPAGESSAMVYSVPGVKMPNGTTATLQYSQSLSPVGNAVNLLTSAALALIPVALVVAVAGAIFLTDRALRPVAAVTEAAAEIGGNDLSRRLPVSGGDEFARLAGTLNGMLSRLETAFTRERRFVADASHELKSPLTIIKANSSLSLTDPDLPENARIALTEIDAAADRTTRIVQDLLLLARSDAGDFTPQRETFALSPLLESAARPFSRLPNAPKIVLDADEGATVHADPEQIRRLVTNLLDNAVRHTPADGTVTLTARAAPFTLIVADTGEGIAPEHLPRLGERFYRPDAARVRATGGTGLGLALSRAIAEAHGGTLCIESAVGKGTRVTVDF